MLRIAVCDDKKEMREYLKELIHRVVAAQIETFESGELMLATEQRFDIVLLDICMSDCCVADSVEQKPASSMDGITVAKKIRYENANTIIIFITALREYVFDAFDVGAFHYLVKPIEEEKFHTVMKKAVMQAEQRKIKEPLFIKMNGTYHSIPIDTILYAENDARKIILHTTNGIFSFYEKMGVLEQKLGSEFFRCHRGFLVHLREVASYDTTSITLKNGEDIFLSKQRYHAFVAAYMHYLTR